MDVCFFAHLITCSKLNTDWTSHIVDSKRAICERGLALMASTRAVSPLTSSAGAINARAVHVRIGPRPRNIHESREVLRVLKTFGEVASFRNLRVCADASDYASGR